MSGNQPDDLREKYPQFFTTLVSVEPHIGHTLPAYDLPGRQEVRDFPVFVEERIPAFLTSFRTPSVTKVITTDDSTDGAVRPSFAQSLQTRLSTPAFRLVQMLSGRTNRPQTFRGLLTMCRGLCKVDWQQCRAIVSELELNNVVTYHDRLLPPAVTNAPVATESFRVSYNSSILDFVTKLKPNKSKHK